MINLKQLILEALADKKDYIGTTYNGAVSGVPVANARSAIHQDHEMISGVNQTNWRYVSGKNVVIWNQSPEEGDKQKVDDFLNKRGVKNPTHKNMYNFRVVEGSGVYKSKFGNDGIEMFWMTPGSRMIEVQNHVRWLLSNVKLSGKFNVTMKPEYTKGKKLPDWFDLDDIDYTPFNVVDKSGKIPDVHEIVGYALSIGYIKIHVEDETTLFFCYSPGRVMDISKKQMKEIKDFAMENGYSITDGTTNRPLTDDGYI